MTASQSGSPPLDEPPGHVVLLNVASPGAPASHPAVPAVQGDDVGAGPDLGSHKPTLDTLPTKQLPVVLDALVDGDLVGPEREKYYVKMRAEAEFGYLRCPSQPAGQESVHW